jgi:hypothetical protein
MPPFEILEHPADIGFRAFGGTLAELFEKAALALVSIASQIGDVAERHEYHLEAAGTDQESLLVAWLFAVAVASREDEAGRAKPRIRSGWNRGGGDRYGADLGQIASNSDRSHGRPNRSARSRWPRCRAALYGWNSFCAFSIVSKD